MDVLARVKELFLCLWSVRLEPSTMKYIKEYTLKMCKIMGKSMNKRFAKIWKNLLGGGRGVAGEIWNQVLVLALAAPSLLCGTHTSASHQRERRLLKDFWASAPAFHTSQCSVAPGVEWLWWERMAALGCSLGNEWMGQHLPAPWLNPRCLMLLSDVVCTLAEMLQLLDPKNREL